MSHYRKPMPSFTLVLTSAPYSFRPSTTLSPAIPPTPPDFLMKTIDLRHDSMDDIFVEDRDQDVDSQTVFEGEQPATFDHVAKQTSTNSVKQNFSLLIRKLVSYMQELVTCKNGPNV